MTEYGGETDIIFVHQRPKKNGWLEEEARTSCMP
jgi:hypothetical protein